MGDINVLVYARGPERYIWLWRDGQRDQVMRSIGRFASDYGLAFDWQEAAKCARSVRETTREARLPRA